MQGFNLRGPCFPPVRAHKFEATLVRPEGTGTWTFLVVPLETSEEFGTKSQVRVKGTVDGHPFRSTLLPTGDGGHFLVVKSDIRRAIAKEAGEKVQVAMERDSEPRSVSAPSDLLRAIGADAKAKAAFKRMAYSHRKAYVDWIEQAKRPETRESRIRKAVGMIAKGSRAT
jgi:Domain of unknown function (DUF1905)/Bacteriocin-protection, YdeI or OmpD-Associated